MTDKNELMHYGILRKSGRYPWGSGSNPYQRSKDFYAAVADLEAKGLTPSEIAKGLGLNSTTDLRATKTIAKNQIVASEISQIQRLKAKQYSNVAIGNRLGISESLVRDRLKESAKERNDILQTTVNMLKDEMKDGSYLQIGEGVERYINVSKEKLSTAVSILKAEGYEVKYVKSPQLNLRDKFTTVKILVPKGTSYQEIYKNTLNIKTINQRTEDYGRSYFGLTKPLDVNSKRILINYAEDGGTLKDGIIELRPGVEDLSLSSAKYAQVRIAVDGTHYLKGMAVYSDGLPDGVDIRFNTNKTKETPFLKVLKPMKTDSDGNVDADNPFGAVIKPGGQRGALNILREEGDWALWSKSLSSQMLSKQPPELIKQQLKLTFESKLTEFEEIMSLTNPVVKQKLLESFADDADSDAVSLHAMGLPRTKQHVILPVPQIKPTEIYAPQYNNGEKVVLIRHPHGGIFEIPELTVNNRNKAAISVLKNGVDAVGIHPDTAEQLSGADFDGDTVLVIPNPNGAIKTQSPLKELKNFDPRAAYPAYEGMKVMAQTQLEMGKISNLITDMTIAGAPDHEIARAVRHSMVVIDAEKHNLNHKQSKLDNGIKELNAKYQDGGGASTIISRAKSKAIVFDRRLRPASMGGPIDPETGKKVYIETGKSYPVRIPRPDSMGGPIDSKTGKKVYIETGEIKYRTIDSSQMEEAEDAFTLSSGTRREALYAEHANKLKALANQARKETLNTKTIPMSQTAKVTYAEQLATLNSKLNIALKNKPLERQAQLLANFIVSRKQQDMPNMDAETLKKVKVQAQYEARARNGAGKQQIVIDDKEWEAIQSGAVSTNKLKQILDNSNLDSIKKLATPRETIGLSIADVQRAKQLKASGYTLAEIASALGVSSSTVTKSLS